MYSTIVKKIQQLLKKQEVVVVAISGHGGAGKSTLADKLARQFGVDDNQIVRIDGLHAKNYIQEKSRVKYSLLRDTLPLQSSKTYGLFGGFLFCCNYTELLEYKDEG